MKKKIKDLDTQDIRRICNNYGCDMCPLAVWDCTNYEVIDCKHNYSEYDNEEIDVPSRPKQKFIELIDAETGYPILVRLASIDCLTQYEETNENGLVHLVYVVNMEGGNIHVTRDSWEDLRELLKRDFY